MTRFLKYLSIALIFFAFNLLQNVCYCQDEQSEEEIFNEENEKCFKCHANRTYSYFNDEIGREVKKTMYRELMVYPEKYYKSNHRSFSCTDCHSYGYNTFPHPGELRMEPKAGCLDCHGGDESYAHFKFEEIEEEFLKSIHSTKHDDAFSCWMCHDPHEYHINARTKEKIVEIIAYDNAICLSCHADVDRYQLLTEKEKPNILETHDWLPNQALHFRKVRCIECHTGINESILVAHNILPKENAVKNCIECHSRDSRLMSSIYRHAVKEAKAEMGFINSVILNEAYVIGANRNRVLNIISIVGFMLVFAVVSIHAILRIIYKSK